MRRNLLPDTYVLEHTECDVASFSKQFDVVVTVVLDNVNVETEQDGWDD